MCMQNNKYLKRNKEICFLKHLSNIGKKYIIKYVQKIGDTYGRN